MGPNFRRKNIRLGAENYRGRRFYFVTICFNERHTFGAEPQTACWLVGCLRRQAAAKGFFVHAYCVMPDHTHLLVQGANEDSDLLDFVNSFKQQTAFEFERMRKLRLWQFKFYDHTLRRSTNSEAVAWYIWLNPVRKGICKTPQEFAHSGSFTDYGMALLGSQPNREWVLPWKKEMPR